MSVSEPAPNSYFARMRAAAAERPEQVALRLVGEGAPSEIGFGTFWERLQATARHLQSLGLGRGETVLIFGQHGAEMLLAFYASQLLGAVPAFMPAPTARQDGALWAASHRALVERLQPRLILASPEAQSFVQLLGGGSVVGLDALARAAAEAGSEELVHPCAPDDVAFLQHSSGTTGLKKGVVVTYRQLLEQVTAYAGTLDLGPDHRVVSWLPIYHDMGLIAATLMPFVLALPVTWLDTMAWLAAPQTFMDELAATPKAVAWMPNFAFAYLAQRCRKPLQPGALRDVHMIVNCSEVCKAPDMERFRAKFGPYGLPDDALQVCYAMAEYVFAVTQTERGADVGTRTLTLDRDALVVEARAVPTEEPGGRQIVSVGRPIPGVDVRIATERDGADVGEIELTGPSLCSGYHLNEAATREKFVDGWYRSGDLGFLRDGELYVTGRKDDRIIVRGRNLYAHDIEEVVTATGQVRPGRCVALGIDDTTGTQLLVVVAERAEGTDGQAAAVISECVLEATGVSPKEVLIVEPETLIKTSSGKMSRSQNAERYKAGTLTRWTSVPSDHALQPSA